MFARKTGELIHLLSEAEAVGHAPQLFVFDPTLTSESIESALHVSRSGLTMSAQRVGSSHLIATHRSAAAQIIGIDDAHFADGQLLSVVEELIHHDIRVVVAGLDLDFTGTAFSETFLALMANADVLEKRAAGCTVCGRSACLTTRLRGTEVVSVGPRVVPGGAEHYEARCRDCFDLQLISHQPVRTRSESAIEDMS